MLNYYKCHNCKKDVESPKAWHINGQYICEECVPLVLPGSEIKKEVYDAVQKPEHYHKYNMDTLTFLEQGFPPEVLEGFCLGSAIKYLQRYELKGGLQDLEKAEFYVKKLKELKQKKDAK